MGIIQKQALRTTVVVLLGTVIGALSQFLLPIVLPDKDHVGALALLNSVSRIFATVFTLGFTQITLQVFEEFRDEKRGHNGYLIFAFIYALVGIVLGFLSFYLLQDVFLGVGEEYQLVRSLAVLIFPAIFFRILFTVMDAYLRMLYKSVAGAFWEGFLLKLLILIGILLFWLSWIDYKYLAYIYTFALSLPGLAMLVMAFLNTKKFKLPKRQMLSKNSLSEVVKYGAYGLIATTSGVLVVSIDQVMVNNLIGTGATGVYSIMFFAGVLVSIPARGIKRIAVPVLTDKWKNNDLKEIESVYRKSVVNLTVMATYLFVVGWLCIAPALSYLPQYQEGLYVFFFIGLGQLLDMMTGVNMEVIATSSSYRLNTYFNIALAVLVIGLNFLFIHFMGLVGAALASAIAMFAVNAARWYFLKRKYGFQPFTKEIFITLVLGGGLIALFKLLPFTLHPIIAILVYAVAVTVLFWAIVLKLNLAPDVKDWLLKIKRRFI